MEKMSVAQARKTEAVGREVRLEGWVRTRRDSKGGFSFIELNDGSCLGNVQVLAERALSAETMTTGMDARPGSRVCSRRKRQPSMTGIIRSRRIRCGSGPWRSCSMASWPLAAQMTVYPW